MTTDTKTTLGGVALTTAVVTGLFVAGVDTAETQIAIAAAPPRGAAITFEWDASPGATGFRVYVATNRAAPWQIAATVATNRATVTNLFFPVWLTVRALAGTNESENSNVLGILGRDTVVTITAESSADLASWTNYATIFKGTNPPGMSFFRTAAKSATVFRLE